MEGAGWRVYVVFVVVFGVVVVEEVELEERAVTSGVGLREKRRIVWCIFVSSFSFSFACWSWVGGNGVWWVVGGGW